MQRVLSLATDDVVVLFVCGFLLLSSFCYSQLVVYRSAHKAGADEVQLRGIVRASLILIAPIVVAIGLPLFFALSRALKK